MISSAVVKWSIPIAISFPKNKIDYMFDSSEYAQSMVSELMGNILTAMLLVLALVVATLGNRSGLLVGFEFPLPFGLDDHRQYYGL